MRVGSLVKLIDNSTEWVADDNETHSGIYPNLNDIYTVTELEFCNGNVYLSFAEIPDEWNAISFRELQIPPSLEAEIAECLTRELQEC